jgi:hypothetical protein
MIRLNDFMRQREENWIGKQVRNIKDREEKQEFLDQCADFILYVDRYCTGERFNQFSKDKDDDYLTF